MPSAPDLLVDGDQIDHLNRFYFRHIALDRRFHASFEGHGRHRAVPARTDEFEFYNVIFADVIYFDVASVGLQVRTNGVKRSFNFSGKLFE